MKKQTEKMIDRQLDKMNQCKRVEAFREKLLQMNQDDALIFDVSWSTIFEDDFSNKERADLDELVEEFSCCVSESLEILFHRFLQGQYKISKEMIHEQLSSNFEEQDEND
jgi:hypothetical protein